MTLSPYQNKYNIVTGERERERERVYITESPNQREREREHKQTGTKKTCRQKMAMLTILTVCVCVDTVTADLTVILVAGVLGCVTLSSLEVTTNDSSGGVAFGAKNRRENKIHIRKINNYNQSRGTSKKPKLCNINTCSTQISHTKSLIGGCYQQLIVWCQVTEAKCLLCEEPFVRLLSAMVSAITWKTLVIEIPRHGVSEGWLLEWWAKPWTCVYDCIRMLPYHPNLNIPVAEH